MSIAKAKNYVLGFVLLFTSCQAISNNEVDYCKTLSADIENEQLYGSWISEPGTGFERITLKEDNTYFQIYSNLVIGISFQIGPNKWYSKEEDGILYVYLDKMRKCDSFESICTLEQGGGGTDPWINFCTDEVSYMENYVSLIALKVVPGDIYYSLSDIKLCQFISDPDGSSVCFRRVTEIVQ